MIKNQKNAVNKLPDYKEFYNQKPVYYVEIKEGNRVIYRNKVYAFTSCFVQSLTKFNMDDLSLEGDSQILSVGHPIIQVFAFDQLRIKLKEMFKTAKGIINYIIAHPDKAKPKLDQLIKDWNDEMKGFEHKKQ